MTDDQAVPLPDDACPFCKRIEAGEYDEEPRRGCYIFEPLNPVTPGHVLVVPGEHVRDASVAPATTAAVMYEAAMKVQRLGGAANIITSVGLYATQTVYHLHVHVVPRRENDGLALPWTDQAAADVLRAEGAATEREACAQLAEQHYAICWTDDRDDEPFAPLIRARTTP